MVVSVSSQDVPSDWRKKKGKGYLMTRRKKVEGTVRDHLVALRLTELEYETVCDLAKEAGMSVSGYLRQQAIFGKVEIPDEVLSHGRNRLSVHDRGASDVYQRDHGNAERSIRIGR